MIDVFLQHNTTGLSVIEYQMIKPNIHTSGIG